MNLFRENKLNYAHVFNKEFLHEFRAQSNANLVYLFIISIASLLNILLCFNLQTHRLLQFKFPFIFSSTCQAICIIQIMDQYALDDTQQHMHDLILVQAPLARQSIKSKYNSSFLEHKFNQSFLLYDCIPHVPLNVFL